MLCLLTACTALLSAAAAVQSASVGQSVFMSAAQKHPFTPLDLVSLDRVSGLNLSPGGDVGVFTRWRYNPQTNAKSKSLWLQPIQPAPGHFHRLEREVQLTPWSEGTMDDEPVFKSDRQILFLRTASGQEKSMLYELSFEVKNGAVDVKVQKSPIQSDLAMANLKYHVTGRFLTFTADVQVDDKKEESGEFTSAMAFDKIYFRHWDQFDNHKNSHVHIMTDDGKTVNLMAGLRQHSCPIPPHGDGSHFAISPDGRELAYASMADFDKSIQAYSTNTNVYVLPIPRARGEEPKCLSCDNKGAVNNPRYSPDGTKIAWLQMETPKYEADRLRVIVYDRATGQKTDMTPGFDLSVGSFMWSMDSKQIYATVEHHGRHEIYTIGALEPSEPEKMVTGGTFSSLAVLDDETLVLGKSSMQSPTEFFTLNLNAKSLSPLSSIHTDRLSNIKKEFWFKGAMDEKVMGWMLKPVDFDPTKKYPLAFLIHGGPQSAWTDSFSTRWNPQIFASAGFVVVAINFHGSTGYGQNFTNAINKNWGTHPFHDLMSGLDYVLETNEFIDGKRVAGLGASYGGYMINWLNGHTNRFACLVNHDGLFDLRSMYYTTEELYFPEYEFGGAPWEQPQMYDQFSPSSFVDKWSTPTLVIHGGKDFRVSEGEGFSTFTALQRRGVESRLVYFPDENHWVLKPGNSLRWHREVLTWITKHTDQ